jgi:hypothetical protein
MLSIRRKAKHHCWERQSSVRSKQAAAAEARPSCAAVMERQQDINNTLPAKQPAECLRPSSDSAHLAKQHPPPSWRAHASLLPGAPTEVDLLLWGRATVSSRKTTRGSHRSPRRAHTQTHSHTDGLGSSANSTVNAQRARKSQRPSSMQCRSHISMPRTPYFSFANEPTLWQTGSRGPRQEIPLF